MIARLLGLDWSGVLIHDGWSPYDVFAKARHQQCLAHLRRRCERILKTARGGAVRFPREVLKLIEAAFAIREAYERRQLDVDETAMQGLALACYLEQLTNGNFSNDQNRRLAKHLKKHIRNWFWFFLEPGIEATNWQAEQAIRRQRIRRPDGIPKAIPGRWWWKRYPPPLGHSESARFGAHCRRCKFFSFVLRSHRSKEWEEHVAVFDGTMRGRGRKALSGTVYGHFWADLGGERCSPD